MAEMRDVQRQPITVKRDCSLGVITFRQLAWTDHVARIVDINRLGVGIELGTCIEPGFVWFKERVWGHRGGLLIWSNQVGARYRAGVKFLPLSPDEGQSVQNQAGGSNVHKPFVNPEKIVASLIESLKNEA